MGYALDTYQVFNFNREQLYTQFASSGRFVTAIIGSIAKMANMSEQAIYIASYVLAILFTFLSIYKLYKIIGQDVQNKILRIILPILIIINPFSIELFLYIENGIMLFAVFMCIYAAEKTIEFFKTNKKRYIFLSIFLMFIANCSYQGVVGIYASIILVYILKYSQTFKKFIKNNTIVALIYGVPAIIDFIIVKIIYAQNRLNGEIIIMESVKKIVLNTAKMSIDMYDILPKYIFVLSIVFLLVIFYYKNRKEKRKLIEDAKVLYIILGVTVIAIIPEFIVPTTAIWFVPRTTYCFGALYGILLLYLVMNYKIDIKITSLIYILAIILLILQFSKFVTILQDRYIVNQKDYQNSMRIIEQMSKYEQKTGKEIKKVAIYQDSSPKYTYDGIFATGDINIKAYMADWSTIGILNYYTKRNLNLYEKEPEYNREFLSKNWDEFSEEQIKFEDETMILCNY